MSEDSKPFRFYGGKGWKFFNLAGLNEAPGWLAVPLTAFGSSLTVFIIAALLWRACKALLSGTPDDVYKILLTFAGALGAPFVAWRTIVAHQQTAISRENHYTTLFTTAVEQLGATREVIGAIHITEHNLEVRLGAIYALERVAQDSERDHWSIMEVLSAYIRNVQNTGAPVLPPENETEAEGLSWIRSIALPRVDVQAAITVIGRRPPSRIDLEIERNHKLDFSGANLQKISFTGNFKKADFSNADLTNSRFIECELMGDELEFARTSGMRFRNVKFLKYETMFGGPLVGHMATDCKFENAMVTGDVVGSRFYGCDFSGADFSGARFKRTRFTRCDFSHASFEGAVFEKNCSLMQCTLSNTNFSSTDLKGVDGFKTLDLNITRGNSETILPPKVSRPES